MVLAGQKRKRGCSHPYLAGNFAPVKGTWPLTPCTTTGTIPQELAGGQYVRNGGNPLFNEDLGRDYHWFDGDGMVAGVSFARLEDLEGGIEAKFTNQFVHTDLYLAGASSSTLRSHIVPSISTLVDPATSLLRLCISIFRTLLIVLLSHLPWSKQKIKRISVANTGVIYHDGRALVTCESGPPMRIQLPSLETVGWYDGDEAEGERDVHGRRDGFRGGGLLGFMAEWTTGHPKVDPKTGELILYHCSFIAPFVHYSVIPSTTLNRDAKYRPTPKRKLLNVPVPGVSGAKMMHDFGVSSRHTLIMDLPLTLDPLNLLRNKPVVDYDPSQPARFGIFVRNDPSTIRWFETPACCIFHTANTWDELDEAGNATAVNFLACRLTSPALVFAAGNVEPPSLQAKKVVHDNRKSIPSFFGKYDFDERYVDDGAETEAEVEALLPKDGFDYASTLESRTMPEIYIEPEEEQCRLTYYRFSLEDAASNIITHQFALSAIPFEFPTVHPEKEMTEARYIYGCSSATTSFNMALGRAVKIDTIVKIDALSLIEKAKNSPPSQCIDSRTIQQVLADNHSHPDVNEPITTFKMPPGWYAQEARFVPRADATSEDDGFLLFYAFDEGTQLDAQGECSEDAVSELWILDAQGMRDVVCRVRLPQRVPYGFHGGFFTEGQIGQQRGFKTLRRMVRG